MKVKELLKTKGNLIITIDQNQVLQIVFQKLVEHNIGALPVCDASGAVLGIITERDLLKECSKPESTISKTKVKDIMTENIAIGVVEDDLDYIASIMNQKKIRHLPIMDEGKLVGIISIRDIAEKQLKEVHKDVRWLSNYISGGFA